MTAGVTITYNGLTMVHMDSIVLVIGILQVIIIRAGQCPDIFLECVTVRAAGVLDDSQQ